MWTGVCSERAFTCSSCWIREAEDETCAVEGFADNEEESRIGLGM